MRPVRPGVLRSIIHLIDAAIGLGDVAEKFACWSQHSNLYAPLVPRFPIAGHAGSGSLALALLAEPQNCSHTSWVVATAAGYPRIAAYLIAHCERTATWRSLPTRMYFVARACGFRQGFWK
jgi:hypothetical protein